jgi:hypothetical protein
MARDEIVLTNDGIINPFEPSVAANTVTNGNENPVSINVEITTVIIIVVIEGMFLGTQITIFSYILTNSNHTPEI